MSEEEVKQGLIDRYVDLLEVKSTLSETNPVLEKKLLILKVKLSSYSLDLASIEKAILNQI